MRRLFPLLALLCACALPAGAAAQQPIPQGAPGDAPKFVGGVAEQRPAPGAPLAPQHPFLAPNGRSNIHDDAYMSDAYEIPGPLGNRTSVRSVFEGRECASVTFDSRGRIVTICVGLDRPMLTLKDPNTLETLAEMALPPRRPTPGGNPFQDFTGGGYFYLDERDRAILPTADHRLLIVALTPESTFEVVRDVDLSGVLAMDDKIISVLPDWSGRFWLATSQGKVVTVARDADVVKAFDTKERNSNSFTVDETGGVFIVTDGALYRFDAAADGTPAVTWRQTYDNTGEQKPGQVNAGSGTTPTLIGRDVVAITDNADPVNVVVYQRGRTISGAREICRSPVFEKGASATDNSLIGAGSSIVVENNYGYTGPTATEGGRSTAPGVERIDFDVAARTCRRVWKSKERSPTLVPKLSLPNGLVYVYTKEPQPTGGADLWYLTAIDFHTGRTVYKVLSGEGLGFNNNYAPVSIGPDGSAYVGVLGGLVRLADIVPPPGAAGAQESGEGPPSSGPGCLPARSRITSRGIAGVVLGLRRPRLEDLFGETGRKAVRLCVSGGGTVRAAFDGRGRVRMVVSTARRHAIRGVRAGSSRRALVRRFRSARRVRGTTVWRSARRGRVIFSVRRGRVRWVGVIPKRTGVRGIRTGLRNAKLRVR
jgi:hypothetical protein